jgi:outer membrane protein assembly factor BamB
VTPTIAGARLVRACLIGAWAAGLGACSYFRSDSNLEPPAELVEFKASATVDEVWSRGLGTGPGKAFVKLDPYIGADAIYASDRKGHVYALDKSRGKILWQTKLKRGVSSGIGVGAGLVTLGAAKGELVALDQASGKQRWTASLSSEILARPAVDSGLVVVQTVDGKLTALAADSGERRWAQERTEPPLSLRGTSAPVALSGVVLAGFANGKIAAFQLKDGNMLWEIPVTEARGRSEIERLVDVDVQPLVAGKTLYAAAYQGKLIAFNLENGRIVWSRDVSTYSGMDSDGHNIYLTDESGGVLALDMNSGASVWKQDQLHGRSLSAPLVTGDYLAVGDFEGYVHWLARDDGHFVARYRPSHDAVLAPLLGEGDTVFVYSQSGELAALRLRAKN